MDRAETTKKATEILGRLRGPSDACDRRTYTDYVTKWIASDAVTIDELATLIAYYERPAEHVVKAIVSDMIGRG